MVLKAILLDNQENFLKFLDSDLITIEETREKYTPDSISVSYVIDDPVEARNLFKVGHKIFVIDKNLKQCLYVIPESLKHDFFKENLVEFEAEEVLTELNFAPLFNQNDISDDKGFTISSKGAVLVDRVALSKWFGDYFEIGVMQECLSETISYISPLGTMTRMELLRFIEDETSNVFVTRYEKDKSSNVIHKYLDFLNPKSLKDQWDLFFEYIVDQECESENVQGMVLNDYGANAEVVVADMGQDNQPFKQIDVTKFELRIIENNESILSLPANEIGLTGRSEEYTFEFNYSETISDDGGVNPNLTIDVIGYSYDEVLADNPNSDSDMKETDNKHYVNNEAVLGTKLKIQLYDTLNDKIIIEQNICPILNKTVGDVLNLGYNIDNITFEVNESDTFPAVAPKLSSSTELSKTDLSKIINSWLKLEVNKGDVVPMIVEKVSLTVDEKNQLGTKTVYDNYYARPLHPQDNTDSTDKTYEYLKATSYWKAPFSKKKDEMYVCDDEDTGIEYSQIQKRVDLGAVESSASPKQGTVETSDEDVYAIFNDVCMKLKEKRFPDINISVDVKNYKNNYDIFDKVYVKVPNLKELIVATVDKTVKTAKDIADTTVELSNFNHNIKIAPAETMIDGENPASLVYPNNRLWSVKVINMDNDTKVAWRLVSFTLQKVDTNGSTKIVNTYNILTDNAGKATLNLNYDPGDYIIKVQFGGDAEFASSSAEFNLNVTGTITKTATTTSKSASKKGKTKTVTKKSYYSKYGVSPDEKTLMAIGKASSSAEKKKYGSKKFWKVIFIRKCPKCGSTKLIWSYNWGSKFKGKVEGGSSEGRIFCEKCNSSYTIFGNDGSKSLRVLSKAVKSSKTEANKLKHGKMLFDSWKVTVKVKNNKGNTGSVIDRSTYDCNKTGAVKNDVKKQAKSIVKNLTGVKAAKEIVKWVVENIKNESREGFYQSPSRTLQRGKGNDRCMCDLILHMCDAAGVMKSGIACYYVYSVKTTKRKTKKKTAIKTKSHVFLRINGKWVDPLMKKHAWGKYKTGYGAIKKATQTRYPCLPYAKKYS